MEDEISRKTITMLVILTVVVSLLGTLSVMSAYNDIKLQERSQGDSGPAEGKVSLTVTDGSKTSSPATGMITFEIQPSEEKATEDRILLLPESTT